MRADQPSSPRVPQFTGGNACPQLRRLLCLTLAASSNPPARQWGQDIPQGSGARIYRSCPSWARSRTRLDPGELFPSLPAALGRRRAACPALTQQRGRRERWKRCRGCSRLPCCRLRGGAVSPGKCWNGS